MARFKDWMRREPELRRYPLGGGVFILVGTEGNWMNLPKEQLDKLNAVATFLENLTENQPPEEQP
jgi:hypothetical protein